VRSCNNLEINQAMRHRLCTQCIQAAASEANSNTKTSQPKAPAESAPRVRRTIKIKSNLGPKLGGPYYGGATKALSALETSDPPTKHGRCGPKHSKSSLFLCTSLLFVTLVSSQLVYESLDSVANYNVSRDHDHKPDCHQSRSPQKRHQFNLAPSLAPDLDGPLAHPKHLGQIDRQVNSRSSYHQNKPDQTIQPKPLHSRVRQQVSSNQRQRAPQNACTDCLAIPLVTVMGDKHFSGFLVPPFTKPQTSEQYQLQHHQQPQLAYHQKQYSAHESSHLPVQRDAHPLVPKSDEKCPMTGPLTVCDQINSYPADVILNKLESAKRLLKQSEFNLDSLFSDERDHSSEPFELNQQSSAQINGTNRDSAGNSNLMPDRRGQQAHRGGPNANIGSSVVDQWNSEHQKYDEAGGRSVEPIRSHNQERVSANRHRYNREIGQQDTSGRVAAADDFIALVERSAFRIDSNGGRGGANAKVGKLSDGTRAKSSLNRASKPIEPLDKYQTNQGYRREARGPTLISDSAASSRPLSASALADRLLSISRSLVGETNELRATLDRPQVVSVNRQPSGLHQSQVEADGLTEEQQAEDADDLSAWAGTLSLSHNSLPTNAKPNKSGPSRRSRRQAAAARAATVEGRQQVNQEADPERNSVAASGTSQAEPVCKARSIYISPKAAVSRGRQFKSR